MPYVFNSDDTNLKPALVMWLLMTTNPKFRTDAILGDPTVQQKVATKLGLTVDDVKMFLDAVSPHKDLFDQIGTQFSVLAHSTGYTGTSCPGTIDPVIGI